MLNYITYFSLLIHLKHKFNFGLIFDLSVLTSLISSNDCSLISPTQFRPKQEQKWHRPLKKAWLVMNLHDGIDRLRKGNQPQRHCSIAIIAIILKPVKATIVHVLPFLLCCARFARCHYSCGTSCLKITENSSRGIIKNFSLILGTYSLRSIVRCC